MTQPPANPGATLRTALYAATAVGTPVVAYLNARGVIGSDEVTLWSAEVAVVSGLAGLNAAGKVVTAHRARRAAERTG